MNERENPIDQIELNRSLEEIGMAGFRVYGGARSMGATRSEACRVVAAWFYSLLLSAPPEDSGE